MRAKPTKTNSRRAQASLHALLVGFGATLLCSYPAQPQEPGLVDVMAYFQKQIDGRLTGLARKTKPVDARPAQPGEIVVTIISGEGKETQSPPAEAGDMVVRNRCAEIGNEQILVKSAKFAQRYEGPIDQQGRDGWSTYRPRGVEMRYAVVSETDGTFAFTAPWGETMVARPGDAIVQDPDDSTDTYRIARAAFGCTYEITRRIGE